ncbi:MAG: stage III sporulation protein AE [Clostridia bacterium]|nr:stage III sporulation protein AE [Clostridia bacterium]
MKKGCGFLLFFLLLLAISISVCAEELDQGLEQAISAVDVQGLERETGQSGLKEMVLRLARGELIWDAQQVLELVEEAALGELTDSFRRMMGLMAPALLCGAAGALAPKRRGVAEMAQSACFLVLAAAQQTGQRLADPMQALFPRMLTLLASVGATSGTALFQPAIAAASGTMTALVRSVSLKLAVGVFIITLLDHLTPGRALSRLAALLRSVSTWTLGIAFTVFLGVTAIQGVTAGAADGIGIRAAKYAVDNFVPVVGGMFADTMDTLVGCSLLVKNALGVTGLALLLTAAGLPLLRTLCAAAVYRLCAALLQPVASERVSGLMHSFSDVLMLLFIIQLSVGAMFLLLTAQMLAVGRVALG